MKCKYPNEACGNQTIYNRKIYCDNANGFCSLHDKEPPMTNGDKIRSMSDEELAEFLDAAVDCSCVTICSYYDKCTPNNATEPICKNHYLNWLQQPLQEE